MKNIFEHGLKKLAWGAVFLGCVGYAIILAGVALELNRGIIILWALIWTVIYFISIGILLNNVLICVDRGDGEYELFRLRSLDRLAIGNGSAKIRGRRAIIEIDDSANPNVSDLLSRSVFNVSDPRGPNIPSV